jgi:class 3 adenylate cyclase
MSNPTFVITKNIVVKYHLLGLLISINYLFISLPSHLRQEAALILSMTGFALVAGMVVIYGKQPFWWASLSPCKNLTLQFLFNLAFYLCTVVALFCVEAYFLNYPLNIAAKSGLAVLGIGFYIAAGIAIEMEYERIRNNYVPARIFKRTEIVPARMKLRYFLSALLCVAWLIFSLMYFQAPESATPHQRFQEMAFVGVGLVSFSIYLFYLYQRNFIYILGMQLNALHHLEENNFNISIPVVSDDELALLAVYHNTLLERLQDRNHLYRTLEKSVGADIMNKLLTMDEQTLKQGQLYSVAILFCDLRGFTSLGESASAEDVILFLNDYFADVSSVISQHHGIINKFMGDAVLAIFGLENKGNPVEDAVNASLAIIQHNIDFYMPNELHPETGVGIDFGSVVGGTIGSEERYEYTIIGDAVNKASRLEGLSKRLNYSIILSENAYQQLSNNMQEHFEDLGSHRVRGRQEALSVFGCGKKQKTAAPQD